MKIAGRIFSGPRVETIVIPREDGDVIFKAKAVLDFDDFDKMCKAPEPPMKLLKGGEQVPMLDSKDYRDKLESFASKKTHWMILKSLEATKDLEWETVKMDNPETWGNFQNEFKASGFSFAEIGLIIQTVTTACGLNQQKIEEATKRFLAGQEVQPE